MSKGISAAPSKPAPERPVAPSDSTRLTAAYIEELVRELESLAAKREQMQRLTELLRATREEARRIAIAPNSGV